jgi:hypothetical protein
MYINIQKIPLYIKNDHTFDNENYLNVTIITFIIIEHKNIIIFYIS